MRYTYKKIAGALCVLLATMVISRFVPDWLFLGAISLIGVFILYLLYYYSRY
jgi:hypothetical protein